MFVLAHAVAVVVSAFFNMKLPTFKNGKISHKMDLTPLEKLVNVVVLTQGSAVGRWYAHNQPSCQRQVMVFVHGVQSLHGRREKASFVLDVNSGLNSQF